jgi:predicted secreted protein
MSDGCHGHGAVLTIAATTIGNIISVSGPEQSRDAVDKSTMDSTNKFREFIPGMADGGEISFDVNYDGAAGATANDLHNAFTATAAQAIVVQINNGGTTSSWAVSGFVTGLGYAIPHDEKVTQSVTIKAAGEPTYTAEV